MLTKCTCVILILMNKRVLLFAVVSILILGGLFVIFQPKSSNTTTPSLQQSPQSTSGTVSPTASMDEIVLTVQNGKIVNGPETITVTQGQKVTLKITADVTDELHLHGYDLSTDLEPNKEATLSFTADKSGRFPFELENAHIDLGAVEVQPQ